MTDTEPEVRLAMWSGPRNISTALLRSWGSRADTYVCDEPLYAHYLLEHGLDHPGREEVMRHHETRVDRVIPWLTGPIPRRRRIFYQKHMAHHLLPEIDRTWVYGLTNCFLIREPEEMLTSLLASLPDAGLADTGLAQQCELFTELRRHSDQVPPVLDARDVLEDPPHMLRLLCERVGVPFDDAMLSWPAGRQETDGIWARYWYANVEASTSFQPYRRKPVRVPAAKQRLLAQCQHHYDELYPFRLGQASA